MSRVRKIGIVFGLLVLLILFVLPHLLGDLLKERVRSDIERRTGSSVSLQKLSLSLLPFRATLAGLKLGSPDPFTANRRIAEIEALRLGLPFSALFGEGYPHSIQIYGGDIHLGITAEGESTLDLYLKQMEQRKPRSKPLVLELVEIQVSNVTLYEPRERNVRPRVQAKPISTRIEYLRIDRLAIPTMDGQRPEGLWSKVALDNLEIHAEPQKDQGYVPSGKKGDPIKEGLQLGRLELSMMQSGISGHPTQFRDVTLKNLRIHNVFRKEQDSTADRIRQALERCLRITRPGIETDTIPLIYLHNLSAEQLHAEVSGPDASGEPVWYRAQNGLLQIERFQTGNGEGFPPLPAGFVRLAFDTDSSEGSGKLELHASDLHGAYPEMTFRLEASAERVALAPWNGALQRYRLLFERGHLASAVSGEAREGKLDLKASVTLSENARMLDTGLGSSINNHLATLANGRPIEPIKVTGTMLKPKVEYPDFAKAAVQAMIVGIASDATKGVIDRAGKTINQSLEKAGSIFRGIGGIFGKKNPDE